MTHILDLDPFDHMLSQKGYPGTPFCDEVPFDAERAAFARDGHACRFCGFATEPGDGYLGLHHLDHDHGNNAPSNLVPACMHCHGTHHAAQWSELGRARIVLLPEMGQAALSVLSRAAAVSRLGPRYAVGRGSGTLAGMLEGAERMEASFEARAKAAKDALGTDDPEVLFSNVGGLSATLDIKARLAPFRIWLSLERRVADKDAGGGVEGFQVHGWMRKGNPYGWLAAT